MNQWLPFIVIVLVALLGLSVLLIYFSRDSQTNRPSAKQDPYLERRKRIIEILLIILIVLFFVGYLFGFRD